jgi:hypothetical protein
MIFGSAKLHSLRWLVNGANTMCTMKEYDKLNLTAAAAQERV